MYNRNTVYIIGQARTNLDNVITEKFKIFFVNFVIDTENDQVVDLSCTATIATTQQFISSIFIGKKFDKHYQEIEDEITRRYFGSSQKALIVAYKDALKNYLEVKKKYYN